MRNAAEDAFVGWRVLGTDAAIVTVSSRTVWVKSHAEAFSNAAERGDALELVLEPPGGHSVSLGVARAHELGWSADGVPFLELVPTHAGRATLADLFREHVLSAAISRDRALGGTDALRAWQWCCAGAIGDIAKFSPTGSFFARDRTHALHQFKATYDAAAPIDVLLGLELVTWLPAFLIPRAGPDGSVTVSATSHEVGRPINFHALATFIAEQSRSGSPHDAASWQSALSARFATLPPPGRR